MPTRRTASSPSTVVSLASIEARIHLIRGVRVMLDNDLAKLYGVETRALNQAVTRNATRFPDDFSFVVTAKEQEALRSQIVISNSRGGRRYATRAFTEQGVAMLSSVLKSPRAIDVNVAIMRAFVHLREMLVTHKDLARRIDELEQRYDGNFADVFDAIRKLNAPPAEPRPRIGFETPRSSAGGGRRT